MKYVPIGGTRDQFSGPRWWMLDSPHSQWMAEHGYENARPNNELYRLRVLGQWFDGIRFYAAASSPRRSHRTWAGLR